MSLPVAVAGPAARPRGRIQRQPEQFRAGLVKDLAEWERQQGQNFGQCGTDSAASGSRADPASTELLTGEVKVTEWGPVTGYVRPQHVPGYFRGHDAMIYAADSPDGNFYSRSLPQRPQLSWSYPFVRINIIAIITLIVGDCI